MDLNNVLANVSNQDIYETIRRVNARYRKIAIFFVQVNHFLFVRREEDQILTIYVRDGIASSAKVSKGKDRKMIRIPRWISSNLGRIFLGTQEVNNYGDLNLFINEWNADGQTWKRRTYQSLLGSTRKSCNIKNKIMITESFGIDSTRVELMSIKYNDETLT